MGFDAASAPLRLRERVRDTQYSWLVAALFWVIIISIIPPDLADPDPVGQDWGAPSAVGRLVKIAMLGVSAFVIMRRRSMASQMLRSVNGGLLLLIAMVVLSVFWSITPSKTASRSVALVTMVGACFAFALASWHPRRFQAVVRPLLTTFLLLSLVLGIIDEKLVLERGNTISLQGAWHGLAVQKNEFGQIASFGALLWLHPWLAKEKRFLSVLPGLAIAISCLALSRSSTSYFALVLCTTVMAIVLRMRRRSISVRKAFVVAIAVFVTLYGLVAMHLVPGLDALLGPIAALTGKDGTFSARTMIWQLIEQHIHDAPILGTGYAAYWTGPHPDSPSYIFLALMYFYPTESHNGYLEVVNDLGLVGLVVLLAYIGIYFRQVFRLMRTDVSQAALLLAILFHQLIINLSESLWLTTGSSFAVLTLATMCLGRALIDQRHRRMAERRPVVDDFPDVTLAPAQLPGPSGS